MNEGTMGRVLVIEDDEMVRMGISRSLRQAGYLVEEAPSAGAALQRTKWASPDLVILDLGLPDADGIDLLRSLRENERFQTTPIVVLTARPVEEAKRLSLRNGAQVFLTKPTRPEELLAHVARFIALSPSKPAGSAQGKGFGWAGGFSHGQSW